MKTPKTNTRNIYQSLSALFYTLKVFGLAPYRFEMKTLSFETSFSNNLISIFTIVFVCLSSYFSYRNFGEGYETSIQSNFVDSLWQCQLIIQHLLAPVTILTSFLKRKRVESFLRQIHKFDQTLSRYNWKVQTSNPRWFNFVVIFLNFLLVVWMIIFATYAIYKFEYEKGCSVLKDVKKALKMVDFWLLTNLFLLISIRFILSVYCVYARLKVLKENVR